MKIFFILMNFCVTSVRKFFENCLTAKEGHVIFQVLLFSDYLSFLLYHAWF